jgi:hypothetical protein
MAKRSAKRAATSKPSVEKQLDTTPNGKRLGGVTGKGFMPGKSGNPNGRRPLAVTLAQHVRDIGSEVIDAATGWTRLDAMIRRLFADAMGGKTQAAEIILERGWGKVMLPVEVDWRVEAVQSGITEDQANAIYAAMVEAARTRMVESGGSASVAAGEAGSDIGPTS